MGSEVTGYRKSVRYRSIILKYIGRMDIAQPICFKHQWVVEWTLGRGGLTFVFLGVFYTKLICLSHAHCLVNLLHTSHPHPSAWSIYDVLHTRSHLPGQYMTYFTPASICLVNLLHTSHPHPSAWPIYYILHTRIHLPGQSMTYFTPAAICLANI